MEDRASEDRLDKRRSRKLLAKSGFGMTIFHPKDIYHIHIPIGSMGLVYLPTFV